MKEIIRVAKLDPARATQFLDLLWGHTVQCDMSSAQTAYEENRKTLSRMVDKPAKIEISIETTEE